jgi:hypothetical protein
MSFDPTKPVEDSPLDAAEMRNQFNGLKALIDAQQVTIGAQQTQITALQSQAADLQAQITAMPAVLGGAKNIDDFVLSTDDISDPPQKAEVEDIQGQLSNLVNALKH